MTTGPRYWRGWRAITAAAVLGLALIGVRGEIAAAGETARTSRTAGVEIVSFAFKPPNLTIPKGSKVVFSNTSSTAHTATRKEGFNTGSIKPGRSSSVSFKRKGTFTYHCSIHPFMRGKVVVD
jgi:plastocyanin